jgi:DNA-binding NarL/FixJ family response regulator
MTEARRAPRLFGDRGWQHDGSRRPLTPAQVDVLCLLAQGCSVAEIADALTISVITVKHHITNARERLGARNRTEAVACWLLSLMHGDKVQA